MVSSVALAKEWIKLQTLPDAKLVKVQHLSLAHLQHVQDSTMQVQHLGQGKVLAILEDVFSKNTWEQVGCCHIFFMINTVYHPHYIEKN